MRTIVRFVVPLLVVAGSAAGLAPTAATTSAEADGATGMSFVGPVIPIDMRSSAEIFPGGLYREQDSDAAAAATRLDAAGQSRSAAMIRTISDQPTAVWLGDWLSTAQLGEQLTRHLTDAARQGRTPVFVTYAIPDRDCGGHSAGGLSPAAYLDWNRAIAAALRGTGAVVLVEPDALAMLTGGGCPGERERRLRTVSQAVDILVDAGITVYLDAGHSAWAAPQEMAELLVAAGVHRTRGIVTNVSNFRRVEDEQRYAETLSRALGGKSYVIDVSRSGNGWQGDWCNPPGAAIGPDPRVTDGRTRLDALLWVKPPGQSDGSCNGGPPAGTWWDDYALDLVRDMKS